MTQIPKQLQYNYVKPKGFSSEFTQWRINPMGGQNVIYPNEILRYQVNLSEGYMDPYQSYWDIEVNSDIPCGALQIDGSAFSTISQSLITCNSSQVERIPEYDQYGDILVQLQYPPIFAAGRQYMGLGRNYYTNSHRAPTSTATSTTNATTIITNTGQYSAAFSDYGGSLFNPSTINHSQATIGAQSVGFLSQSSNQSVKAYKTGIFSKFTSVQGSATNKLDLGSVVGNVPSFVSQLNASLFYNTFYQTARDYRNGIVLPRVDYNLANIDTRFVDTKTSLIRNGLQAIGPYNHDYDPTKPTVPYVVGQPDSISIKYYDPSKTQSPKGVLFSMPNQCGIHGFQNPYSQYLSIGLQEPFVSPTIPQCGMKNGRILDRWLPVNKLRLVAPFLSACMGCLIPQDQYSLLPMKALNVYIQLTLNKYAMFSSGYNDRTQFDTAGMKTPIQRDFYYTRYDYVLSIYYFNQQSMKSYLSSSLQQGIYFSSQGLLLTSLYMLQNQLSLRGAWQINTPSAIVSEVIVRFLDAAYLRYPFLRKQYALSMGVTSMQIKYDVKWYPPQPIIGNAGNPYYLDSSGCVQPYLQALRRSRDLTFSHMPSGVTNNINFAINGRIFDYKNTNPLLPAIQTLGTQFSKPVITSASQINTDTAMGYPAFHENRVKGRAIYINSFQAVGHSKGLINGLPIGGSRPFQIIFNTSVEQPFEGEVGMYIFCRLHYTVRLGQGFISMNMRGIQQF